MLLRTMIIGLFSAVVASCGPVFEAERVDTVSRTFTVRDLDREARRLTVVGDGERYVLRVSEDVVAFDEIEVGDRLDIELVEAVAVSMAEPSDDGDTIVAAEAVVFDDTQSRGVVGGEVVSGVVEFVSYDPAKSSVMVRTQTGDLVYTRIRPEMRRFAASRQPGERIVVNIVTGLAISITPAV